LLEVGTILQRECIALIRSALDDRSKEIFVVRYFALPRWLAGAGARNGCQLGGI